MVDVVWIESSHRKYPFTLGTDLLTDPTLLKPFLADQSVLILSHPDIAPHYLPTLHATCEQAQAARVEHYLLPSGEAQKTLATAEAIWSFLLRREFHRDTVIIALGGGMIGDLAGFVAACYMRGVGVIQIPTTLLAQIDASIGGKTGVNHPLGKNVIGAFYPPLAVFADVGVLSTLPSREFQAGLAELIKYGVALDADLFAWLETHMPALVQREHAALIPAIHWAARCKAKIVSRDERENDTRILLNFGHTIAHAIENLLHYQEWLHGEAVAVGMLVAVSLSVAQGLLSESSGDRLVALLTTARLPVMLPKNITAADILTRLKKDKKHRLQKLSWVLLRDLGQAYVTQAVSTQTLTAVLKAYGAK